MVSSLDELIKKGQLPICETFVVFNTRVTVEISGVCKSYDLLLVVSFDSS